MTGIDYYTPALVVQDTSMLYSMDPVLLQALLHHVTYQ